MRRGARAVFHAPAVRNRRAGGATSRGLGLRAGRVRAPRARPAGRIARAGPRQHRAAACPRLLSRRAWWERAQHRRTQVAADTDLVGRRRRPAALLAGHCPAARPGARARAMPGKAKMHGAARRMDSASTAAGSDSAIAAASNRARASSGVKRRSGRPDLGQLPFQPQPVQAQPQIMAGGQDEPTRPARPSSPKSPDREMTPFRTPGAAGAPMARTSWQAPRRRKREDAPAALLDQRSGLAERAGVGAGAGRRARPAAVLAVGARRAAGHGGRVEAGAAADGGSRSDGWAVVERLMTDLGGLEDRGSGW